MKKIILPFCVLLAAAQPVLAEDDLTQIIISATGSEESEVLAPVSLSVITSKEIKSSGANTLTEVLRKQAGIQIKDNIGDGSRAFVSLRGFGANSVNNVLIVVDGRKLNNPSLEAPLLTSISLKDIERIEVIQGSGGVLYGDQAVGGVINIITKKFQEESLYISTTQGTDNLETYRAGGSQTFNNGVGYRVSAEKRQADNYRDNNESDYTNIFAEIGYDADWGNVNYERSYIEDKLNLPGFLTNDQIAEDRRQTNTPDDFFNNRINIDNLNTSLFLNENLTLDTDFSRRDSEGDINSFGRSEQNTEVRTVSSKVIGDWALSQGNINFIGGYEELKSDYFNSGFAAADIENTQESFYAQLSYPIVNGLNVVAGARRTENTDENLLSSDSNDDSLTAKEVGLNYRTKLGRFFVRRAEAFRFANADENGFTEAGVDFLDPQESVSYEAGYEYNTNNKSINFLVYDLTIDDEIFFESSVGGGRGRNVNLEESKRQGIVLELGRDLSSNINIGGSFSYIKAEYLAGQFSGNQVADVPERIASTYIEYKLKHNVNLYLDAIYTGSRFSSGDEANISDKQPSYTLVNFSASWATGPLDLGLRINNLNNEKYSSLAFASGGYPSPERTVELTASYNIF